MKRLLCIALLGMSGLKATCSQPMLVKYVDRLTLPKSYVCFRCEDFIRIDGVMDEESWKRAPYTESFVDIRGERWPSPRQTTRANCYGMITICIYMPSWRKRISGVILQNEMQ